MAIQNDACSLIFEVASRLKNPLDHSSTVDELIKRISFSLANGNGASQANRHFHDQRTLSASASEELDLAGALVGPFGETITFANIKALIIYAATSNTNNVEVGAAAANPFGVGQFVKDASDINIVEPGGLMVFISPGGLLVSAGTGDKLKIANSAGGTSVVYDIILIGGE